MLVLALSALLVLLFATGWPQRAALEYALTRSLGVAAEVYGVDIYPVLTVDSLRIHDSPGEDPVLAIHGLTVEYQLSSSAARAIPRCSADHVWVNLQKTGEGATNYDFVRELMARPSSGSTNNRYLPEDIHISELDLRAVTPQSELALDGAALSLAFESTDSFALEIEGAGLLGNASVAGTLEKTQFADGELSALVRREGPEWTLESIRAELPGIATAALTARANVQEDGFAVSAAVDELSVEGRYMADILADFMPIELVFDHLEISDSLLDGLYRGGRVESWDMQMKLDARDMRLGPLVDPLYAGDLRAQGWIENRTGEVTLTLNSGQEVTAIIEDIGAEGKMNLTVDEWSREEIDEALPAAYSRYMDYAPHLTSLGGTGDVAWRDNTYNLNLTLSPVFTRDDASVTGTAVINGAITKDGPLFAGDVLLQLSSGKAGLAVTVDDSESYTVTGDVENLALNEVMRVVLGKDDTPLRQPVITGSVDYARTPETITLSADIQALVAAAGGTAQLSVKANGASTAPVEIFPLNLKGSVALGKDAAQGSLTFTSGLKNDAFDLTAETKCKNVDLRYLAAIFQSEPGTTEWAAVATGDINIVRKSGEVRVAADITGNGFDLVAIQLPQDTPATIKGNAVLPETLDKMRGSELHLTLSDMGEVSLKNWSYVIDPPAAEGEVTFHGEMDYLTEALEWPLMRGILDVTGPIKFSKDIFTGNLHLIAADAGMGAFAMPYGAIVDAGGAVLYNTAAKTGTVTDLNLSWPDGASITGPALAFTTDPLTVQTPFTYDGSLQPMVDFGYLGQAEGNAQLKGDINYGPESLEFAIDGSLAAETLVLKDNLAGLAGTSYRGSFALGSQVEADGIAGMATVVAFGARIYDVSAKIDGNGTSLELSKVTGTLWKGALAADISWGLLEEKKPIRLKATFTGMDLADFTEKYKPPKVKMTGLADGDVELVYNEDGIQSLHARVWSEKDFTLNKDAIQELLLEQQLGGSIGDRLLGIKQVVGKAEQRPFDRAELDLEWVGDGYKADISMRSKALDLTVTLNVDEEALAAGLALRQQNRLDQIEQISAQPVALDAGKAVE